MSKRDNMLPLTLQFQVCIYSYQTKILASNPRWERHGFFFFFWNISRSVAYFINREGSQGSNKICKYIWGLKGKKYRSFILAKVKTKNSSNYIIWLWRCRVQFFWRKNETRFMDGSKKKSGMEVGHKGIKCHLVTAMKSQCLCQILWWIGGIQLAQWQFKPEFVGSFCAAARKMDYIHNLPIENRSPVLPLPPNTISEAFLPTNMWWPSRSKKTVQLLAILRGKREAYRTLCSC